MFGLYALLVYTSYCWMQVGLSSGVKNQGGIDGNIRREVPVPDVIVLSPIDGKLRFSHIKVLQNFSVQVQVVSILCFMHLLCLSAG